ncbi:duf726 domain containing protein [Grosmannia clavigera kw1407]|uniref:Duf726 domain containing protein n=1 Tax=Grosmannia clavigera (strain kw1407 / UAMH 11150) TaxID=655863 RepID=F0X7Y4_GROCL|nr:duf726 domain containing protein [Grosmannia clavigera kw1407]EFX06273.1 duf726 domain containing protein [Grosmannia clavigera kw1407]
MASSTAFAASFFVAPRTVLAAARLSRSNCRSWSTSSPPSDVDVAKLLERPTWSVRALLPSQKSGASDEDAAITPALLRHLLRLSALPLPSSPDEQAAKIETLRSQLHFVRDVQGVNTAGLRPLQSIRDETREAIQEQTIGIKQLEQALLQEESFGHRKRPRRRQHTVATASTEEWDVLGLATRTAGNYIVVDSGEQ